MLLTKRIIEVDIDWFQKLEEYLQCDERFVEEIYLNKTSNMNLVLYTPFKKLIFTYKKL